MSSHQEGPPSLRDNGESLGEALVRGLLEIPWGPDRVKMCVARRAEIFEAINQVATVLDDTQICLEGWARGLVETPQDQKTLILGRLSWALDMATGLRNGALALEMLELSDLLCDNVIPAVQESKARQLKKPAEEYRSIEKLLCACVEYIRDLHEILVTPLAAEPDRGSDVDIVEALGEEIIAGAAHLGKSFWPLASKLLRPMGQIMEVLLVAPLASAPSPSNAIQARVASTRIW
jgi:hypothetical protein